MLSNFKHNVCATKQHILHNGCLSLRTYKAHCMAYKELSGKNSHILLSTGYIPQLFTTVVGIFRWVIFSWFSWSRGKPQNEKPRVKARATRVQRRACAQNGCGFSANRATTKFSPRNSQNYDFHENITPQKIPAIRYTGLKLRPHQV